MNNETCLDCGKRVTADSIHTCSPQKGTREMKRIPRKAGQPAKSDKHSDLYTDEDPKGTITGLKFATAQDARASVAKIKSSGRSHACVIPTEVYSVENHAKWSAKDEWFYGFEQL